MAATTEAFTETTLTPREAEIAQQQKLIEHARHQRKVGTITRMRRQELSHAEYVVRLSHYMKAERPIVAGDDCCSLRASTRWVTELRNSDFRAYQSKLAAIDLRDHEACMWWFGLGDEQRYSLVRCSMGAVRDEAEQEKRNAYLDRQKAMKESGEL